MKLPLLYKDRREEGKTLLRQTQLVQLHLLHVFDSVCREHGLRYCLIYGTLIGAMRHDGFIPWDDDLDVAMPRDDYERFLKVAKEDLLRDVLLHRPQDTPHTAIPFAKLRDAYSYFYESRPDISNADPSGIYLDVFPLERGVGRCRGLFRALVKVCGSAWSRSRWFMVKAQGRRGLSMLLSPLSIACDVVWMLSRLLIRALVATCGDGSWTHQYESGGVVRYAKDDMFPCVPHVFEDAEFMVPRHADVVLTADFGDWRRVPPEEERPRHTLVIDPFHAAFAPWAMDYARCAGASRQG